MACFPAIDRSMVQEGCAEDISTGYARGFDCMQCGQDCLTGLSAVVKL